MPRKAVEVAPQCLYIHGDMRHRLGTVDEHGHPMGVGDIDDALHGIHGTERVGDVVHSHDACLRSEKSLVSVKVEDTLVAERDRAQCGACQLPRDDVGVMFHARHDDLVVTREIATAER